MVLAWKKKFREQFSKTRGGGVSLAMAAAKKGAHPVQHEMFRADAPCITLESIERKEKNGGKGGEEGRKREKA